MRTYQTEITLPHDLQGSEREEIVEYLRGSSDIALQGARLIVTISLCCKEDLYDLAMVVTEIQQELDSYWPGLDKFQRPIEIPAAKACCGGCKR